MVISKPAGYVFFVQFLPSLCPQRYAREGPGTILLSVCDKAPDLSDISLNGKHCKLLAVDSVDYFTVESSKLH